MTARLIGVGVGPGDPELVTVKALRALREADAVFVPVADSGEVGRAEAVVAAQLPGVPVRRLVFALTDVDGRAEAWDAAGAEVAAALDDASSAAFATIGDPNVYSTFSYLAQTVRALVPGLVVDTVPGIMAFQDLAARSGSVLVEGTERLALLPLTAGMPLLRSALADYDTVVCYKGGRVMPQVVDALQAAGRLDGAVYGADLGLPGERIAPVADVAGPAPYLSTVLAPARRTTRGGRL